MHVTILHLTTGKKAPRYMDDEVFADNQDKFPGGVETHTGEGRDDDIRHFVESLGGAATTGTERGMTWIEIDRKKAIDVFRKPFDSFLSCVNGLHSHDIRDFATGGHGLGDAILRLNDAYHFDDFYICCDGLCAQPVSDWLRCIIGCTDVKTRYYVRETYIGGQ